jgi:hypothetical protein
MLVFKLEAKRELAVWLTGSLLLLLELLLLHTFYVTTATYWYGGALFVTLAFMFLLRVHNISVRPRWLRVVSNIVLTSAL